MTPSTGGMRTCGVSHRGRTWAPCPSSSSVRSSCTRCSSRSSASESSSTSCCTTPARWCTNAQTHCGFLIEHLSCYPCATTFLPESWKNAVVAAVVPMMSTRCCCRETLTVLKYTKNPNMFFLFKLEIPTGSSPAPDIWFSFIPPDLWPEHSILNVSITADHVHLTVRSQYRDHY